MLTFYYRLNTVTSKNLKTTSVSRDFKIFAQYFLVVGDGTDFVKEEGS